jgi:sugar-specific transcriptional regulator TrmB
MTNFLLKSISPQSADIYRMLEKKQPMSAKEIGRHLNIFPNAAYRAIKQLMQAGLVEQIPSYPIKFAARPTSEGLDFFTSLIRQNFQDTFGSKRKITNHHEPLKLVFVQTRNQTIKMTEKDAKAAKESINLIVSGLQLPAETLLANQRAVERGVKVRWLIQNLQEVTKESLRAWQKAGIEVRYYPNMEARIYVYDHHIVYFTSYDPKNKEAAIGMRFDYEPFAVFMDELFEQRWKMGKIL